MRFPTDVQPPTSHNANRLIYLPFRISPHVNSFDLGHHDDPIWNRYLEIIIHEGYLRYLYGSLWGVLGHMQRLKMDGNMHFAIFVQFLSIFMGFVIRIGLKDIAK